jgi:recombination protein RecR
MLPDSLQTLAQNFKLFPGVGTRSSQKMALDALQMKDEDFNQFIKSLYQAKQKVKFCHNCGFFADIDQQPTEDKNQNSSQNKLLCQICLDPNRDQNQICIVEKATDVLVMEKSETFRGKYFVLQKLISPLDNIFPEDTNISYFINTYLPNVNSNLSPLKPPLPQPKTTTQNHSQIELILFFKAGFSADATTLYLKESISDQLHFAQKIKISRLAQGLPLYYNPDTLDKATMIKALEDRKNI